MLADVKPGTGQRTGEGRLSWPVFLLTLAAVTSSSLSALSLYQLVALRAEVEGLKSEVGRRREGREAQPAGQTENLSRSQPGFHHAFPPIRKKRLVSRPETSVSQPCLQLLANSSRKTFQKGIPWQAGLRRGSALQAHRDALLVLEDGFYFVYSQVYYMDATFAMGHLLVRRKWNVVGDEPQDVVLFRCIQNMNPEHPYNTCYTGGVVRLEVGDQVELLIPRSSAAVSLCGDATFLGAVKLA
ncbi:tumor necrosis factor ligand superfamily member 13B isoform X2 [Clinocottus analis]|uniref:tumor necrosis factor ligand superfamily member 13B isoform X2 n=1 Tax=Clinocottus analis TaxID=304258 RepID=UPI0035BEE847